MMLSFLLKPMRVLVLGCGHIGSVAAEDLAESTVTNDIVVADKDGSRAEDIAKRIGRANVSGLQLDISDHDQLIRTLRDFDLVMGFLPGDLGHELVLSCVEAGKNLVDVSYMPENCLKLDERALEADITIILDCGLAPGISNILVGHATTMVDEIRRVHIMVGGLPERNIPPLGYVVTWSPENLIDEYTRRAKIIQDCKMVEVEALSGLEEVELPHFGKLEAFYTDGLRTLPYTIRNVKEMWEKTLRYPGHAEKVRLLRSLGFFDEKPIVIGDTKLSPKELTTILFDKKLRRSDAKDIVVMKIEVEGARNNVRTKYTYTLMDRHDEDRGITAMARTTAYPASVIAQLVLTGVISEKGVIPLEKLGMDESFFSVFLNQLKDRGVKIREKINRKNV
ncbi:MAG: saccharopine dehydrogenase family protein [Candidatus Bathyarchaeota archaeon]|jgi:saccharopine dehydrogenase-like NADP-dependent oxidoreductase